MITPQRVYNKLSPDGKMEVLKLESHLDKLESDIQEINKMLDDVEKSLGIIK